MKKKGLEKLVRALRARANQLGTILPKSNPKTNIDPQYIPIKPESLLIVISGPSGVGKDTIVTRMKEMALPFHFVVTATTRMPKENEVHGVDYYFYTFDEFAELIDQDELIEYSVVYGEYKGILKQQVREALISGKDVVMKLDVNSAEKVRRLAPEAVLIFLTVENEDQLKDRLRQRRTETPVGLKLRLASALKELKMIDEFDYVVVNRDFQVAETVEKILSIVYSEHQRIYPRKVSI